jgi:hypothetical protein
MRLVVLDSKLSLGELVPMRKKTFSRVCFILALAIVFILKSFARSQGINLPFVGVVAPLIACFIIVPLLLAR